MIKSVLLNMALFTLFDLVWWGFIAKGVFKDQMSHLARMDDGSLNIFFPSAIFVYVLMSIVLAVFVTDSPVIGSAVQAFLYGALLGLGLFATFDFTNHALVANYPIKFAVIDTSWGTFMCGMVSLINYLVLR